MKKLVAVALLSLSACNCAAPGATAHAATPTMSCPVVKFSETSPTNVYICQFVSPPCNLYCRTGEELIEENKSSEPAPGTQQL